MRRIRHVGAIAAASLTLLACGAPLERTPETSASAAAEPTPPPTAESGASVSLSKPDDGATMPAGTVSLVADVANFDVVAKQFQPPVEGQGHVHFYLDVDQLPTTHARPATGEYRSVSRTTYTWTGVERGKHTLAVQLVGNDHVPLDPPARDEVRVTLE